MAKADSELVIDPFERKASEQARRSGSDDRFSALWRRLTGTARRTAVGPRPAPKPLTGMTGPRLSY